MRHQGQGPVVGMEEKEEDTREALGECIHFISCCCDKIPGYFLAHRGYRPSQRGWHWQWEGGRQLVRSIHLQETADDTGTPLISPFDSV